MNKLPAVTSFFKFICSKMPVTTPSSKSARSVHLLARLKILSVYRKYLMILNVRHNLKVSTKSKKKIKTVEKKKKTGSAVSRTPSTSTPYRKEKEFISMYLILPWHLFHLQQVLFHSLTASISFSDGIYFICNNFYFILPWHLFHAPMASISVLTFISFSHGIFIIKKKKEKNRG